MKTLRAMRAITILTSVVCLTGVAFAAGEEKDKIEVINKIVDEPW